MSDKVIKPVTFTPIAEVGDTVLVKNYRVKKNNDWVVGEVREVCLRFGRYVGDECSDTYEIWIPEKQYRITVGRDEISTLPF